MAMKIVGRERRKLRIRKKVVGSTERPRMSVFRSAKHIYAQVIDDVTGKTLAHASTLSKDLKGTLDKDKKIDRVVFDRNGYMYHGRVSALAEAAREAGLEF